MALVFLSLGSNMGDRNVNLELALDKIRISAGNVLSVSGIYETKPWGYESLNLFLNLALCLETELEPLQLLKNIKIIEHEMGRDMVSEGYIDRPIDIDIIFYDDFVIQLPELSIPHPQMERRIFVLEPLNEIAPDYKHPILKIRVNDLFNMLINK